ncbi:MAG: peptidase M24 [Rhodobacteraceae bacterium]|nr:peptidase M24 [Paracoccaceae bacterium]
MVDFPVSEFNARLARAQTAMATKGFDALLLNTEAEVRYFTGFRSLFWQSPTRPWFLIVPQSGELIAVIPSIGAELMGQTWVNDIRTWPSPRGEDEGISLLIEVLSEFDCIGLPMGEEASLRMSLKDFLTVEANIQGRFDDCSFLIKELRIIKSQAEIAVHREICRIGSNAFARLPNSASAGDSLVEVFRKFKIILLEEGAEEVPYLVGGLGPGGYGDVISPPGQTPLEEGDVLMLDTGSSLRGYFCDFDRNFAVGIALPEAQLAHQKLWDVTQAGLEAARSGITCAELFAAMSVVLGGASDIGRIGHGLGMQLTEWPSIAAHDQTELKAGMVMTLEPSLMIDEDRMMVVEENILITEGAPELLTSRASRELVVI